MAIEDYERDMQKCTRCSYCKWIPYESQRKADFMQGCPSIVKYKFHTYSAGGKFNLALSLLKNRIGYSDIFLDAVYKCQMDGNCDVSCKAIQDIEPLQLMQELRIKCVEDGQVLPAHTALIDRLRKQDSMAEGSKARRGKWAEGLNVKDVTKDKAKVLYYAGCMYSFDEELQPAARGGLSLLKNAGVDVGILGGAETCCGGPAYEIGYAGELIKYADRNIDAFKKAGVETVVTACAGCYQAFKVLYDKVDKKLELEVLHITEYLDRLIKEGKIKLTKEVPLTVTYHDPCHLGRLAEPWVPWKGKIVKVLGQLWIHDPPKKFRRGTNGVYDVPRNILRSIPGLNLVEMYRNRESAWCCGAGGGVKEAYPDFATWTGAERLQEAKAVGAKALVTACPSCKRNFLDAAKETGERLKVYDIIELVQKSV